MKEKKKIWQYIKNYRFRSIFIRNFFLITIILILPFIAINVIVYDNSKLAVESEINSLNINSLQKERDFIDNIFYEADRLALNILLRDHVQMYMLSNSDLLLSNAEVKIQNDINQLWMVNKYLHSIFVYSEDNQFVVSNMENVSIKQFHDNKWLSSYNELKFSKDRWMVIRKYEGVYPNLISSIRPIISKNRSYGAVVVNIDVELLGKIINNMDNQVDENLFVVDKTGIIFYCNQMDNIGKRLEDIREYDKLVGYMNQKTGIEDFSGSQCFITGTNSKFADLRYISIIPMINYAWKFSASQKFIMVLLCISIFVAFTVAFFITLNTYQPVKKILSIIENTEKIGSGASTQKKMDIDEIKYIVANIERTILSNSEMEKELTSRMSLLNKAQSEALQYQINPHFLINTLESINWIAVGLTNGENEVSTMVNSLADLFRSSMDTKKNLIPIAKEIEYLKQYLYILKTRYKDKFEVIWNIHEEILQYKIIKLSLQPIVENSIYHGIKPKRKKGYITISSFIEGSTIYIKIHDDGVGIDTSTADILNKSMSMNYISEESHIGLKNVNQRIKLLFGEEYGLLIESIKNSGTLVTMKFPAEK